MDFEKFEGIFKSLRKHPVKTSVFIVCFLLVAALGIWGTAFLTEWGRQHAVAPTDTNRTKKDERIDPLFDVVLAEYPELRRKLGIPTTIVRNKPVVIQHYTKGFMIWLYEDSLNIFVCFDDGQQWSQHRHVTVSSEESKLLKSLKPETQDKFNPIGGFLQVWLRYKLSDVIGVPLVQEHSIQSSTVQNFQNGILIRDVPWFNRTSRLYIPVGPGKAILILIGTKDNKREWKLVG